MAYISYNNLWKSKFYNIVSKEDKLQDINNNPIKLKVFDIEKDEEIPIKFETIDGSNFIQKAHLNDELSNLDDHLSLLKKRLQLF